MRIKMACFLLISTFCQLSPAIDTHTIHNNFHALRTLFNSTYGQNNPFSQASYLADALLESYEKEGTMHPDENREEVESILLKLSISAEQARITFKSELFERNTHIKKFFTYIGQIEDLIPESIMESLSKQPALKKSRRSVALLAGGVGGAILIKSIVGVIGLFAIWRLYGKTFRYLTRTAQGEIENTNRAYTDHNKSVNNAIKEACGFASHLAGQKRIPKSIRNALRHVK